MLVAPATTEVNQMHGDDETTICVHVLLTSNLESKSNSKKIMEKFENEADYRSNYRF